MSSWRQQLHQQLSELQLTNLQRKLGPVDRCARSVTLNSHTLLNFASNDYLALASHPHIRDAVITAATQYGTGAGASRLITGHLDLHAKLEQRFAKFKHAQAALLCPTGYMANLAVITTLAKPGDLICLDQFNHASLIDAARASNATVRIFSHRSENYLTKLESLLNKTKLNGVSIRRKFIITDSVFSMDGDTADIPALCKLRDRFDAILIVDEAHATGLLGSQGSGLAELQNVADQIDITISTASKALGSLGGIITADQVVIDTLINTARSFIYTTAVPPTQVAAIDAALDVVRDEPERRTKLIALSQQLRQRLRDNNYDVPNEITPIVPVIVGEPAKAIALSKQLQTQGFLVPAIRPPTVAPGSSRLRISLRCDHTQQDIEQLTEALGKSP